MCGRWATKTSHVHNRGFTFVPLHVACVCYDNIIYCHVCCNRTRCIGYCLGAVFVVADFRQTEGSRTTINYIHASKLIDMMPSGLFQQVHLTEHYHETDRWELHIKGVPSPSAAPAAIAGLSVQPSQSPSAWSHAQFGAENKRVRPLGRLPHVVVVLVVQTPQTAIKTCDQDGRLIHTRVPQEGDVQRVRHRSSGIKCENPTKCTWHHRHRWRGSWPKVRRCLRTVNTLTLFAVRNQHIHTHTSETRWWLHHHRGTTLHDTTASHRPKFITKFSTFRYRVRHIYIHTYIQGETLLGARVRIFVQNLHALYNILWFM